MNQLNFDDRNLSADELHRALEVLGVRARAGHGTKAFPPGARVSFSHPAYGEARGVVLDSRREKLGNENIVARVQILHAAGGRPHVSTRTAILRAAEGHPQSSVRRLPRGR